MAHSSILGADVAPSQPSGRDAEALGPSDSSDTGSDALGTSELHADSDATGTGERGAVAGADAREGADILPDRVVNIGGGGGGADDLDVEFTDLEPDASTPDADEDLTGDES